MTVRNPVKRSRSGVRRHGGQSTLKTVGAIFLFAVASFAVGFFVLARFWSSPAKSDNSANPVAISGSDDRSVGVAPSTPVQRNRSQVAASPSTGQPAQSQPVTGPGPQIGPADDEVHPARGVDDGDGAVKTADDSEFAGKNGLDDSAKDSAKPPTASGGAASTTTPPAAAPIARRRRRRDVDSPAPNPDSAENSANTVSPIAGALPTTDAGRDQPKEQSNGGAATENGVQPALAPDAPRPARSSLYRVQIGVFSTREKADAEAKRASNSGFSTHVQAVVTGDRTLYRVQQSAYRNRANAEMERRKLTDAGFDATIINPSTSPSQ